MSENIPESVPTSRTSTQRPAKRARTTGPTTASTQQAQTLESLFANPEREITIPSSALSTSKTTAAHNTPEIVNNVQGSSAGAGSGEFHVYKASRRREYERLRAMDEEVEAERDQEVFERERREREVRDLEKTRRNREKRRGKGSKGDSKRKGVVDKVGGLRARVDGGGGGDGGDEAGGQRGDGGLDATVGVQSVVSEPQGLIIHDDD